MPRRVLIAGPPAAGKSTLADRIANESGAVVIDFDRIAVELGSPDSRDHPAAVMAAAEREYHRRIAAAPLDAPLVVIRCAPDAAQRAALAARMGATETVVLDVPAEEAKRRAVAAGRPDRTAALIDRWWRDYTDHPSRNGEGKPETGDSSMSESTTEQQPTEAPATEAPETVEPKTDPKPTETVDFWKQKARENEKRAKANAEKAAEFEKWQESQKTEAQRQADALAAYQRQAEQATAEALRYKAAATHNVGADWFDLLGTGSEDEIVGRAERLGSLLKAQAEADQLRAEVEALRKGRPQSAAVPNLRPGATPEEVVADDSVYPASWTSHQRG